MGSKPRTANRVLRLAEAFQQAEAKFQEAQAQLEAVRAERDAAWTKLLAAGPGVLDGADGLASVAPAGHGKRKNGRRSPRQPPAYYTELQGKLMAKMKRGTKYTGPDLQTLVGVGSMNEQTFAKRVRLPLVENGKIKRSQKERGNQSPANVRWIVG